MKAQSKKAAQAYQHLLDNPGAKVASVAKRFKLSVPYVYKLKARANPEAQKKDSVITLVVEETKKDVGRISEILDSRARVYGTFRDNARLAQALKRTMADHAQDLGKSFADDQWEALEMVSSKMSRIVNGNADDLDQWDDIAGYATLVADRLRGLVR